MAGCSLNKSSKHNWVEDEGGLPEYVCVVARAIIRGGKDIDSAIPIAISRIKLWASGKGVDTKTQAKAAKALAEWERKKTSAKARRVVKASVVDASEMMDTRLSSGEEALLRLSVAGYDPHPGLARVLARVGRRSGG